MCRPVVAQNKENMTRSDTICVLFYSSSSVRTADFYPKLTMKTDNIPAVVSSNNNYINGQSKGVRGGATATFPHLLFSVCILVVTII